MGVSNEMAGTGFEFFGTAISIIEMLENNFSLSFLGDKKNRGMNFPERNQMLRANGQKNHD